MSEFSLDISKKEAEKALEIIKSIARKEDADPEPITSWEISKIFQRQHIQVFNQISLYVNTKATEDEKSEFQIGERVYRASRKHPIWKLSERGCRIYADQMCKEMRRSRAFIDGMRKFNDEIERRFHGSSTMDGKKFLMNGRSRDECWYIKALFDRFVSGPALENREIQELGWKYEEFYRVMSGIQTTSEESCELENAVMGVAIEAEMQGFIYGFKVFELLAGKALATA